MKNMTKNVSKKDDKLNQIVHDIKKYRDEPLLKVIKLAELKGATKEEISSAIKQSIRSVYRLTNNK